MSTEPPSTMGQVDETLPPTMVPEVVKKPSKPNPWRIHVDAFRASNPTLSYKQVLQQAKLTYTKVKKE